MEKKSVCILDYGSGNVKSVYNVLKFLDYNVKVSNSENDIKNCSHIILPGVGAFGASMEKIMSRIPFDVLENEIVSGGKPFLGICVGMQVLADKGMEFGEFNGFGWIPGIVDVIKTHNNPLPHIGWNDIIIDKDTSLFNNLGEYRDFYFVHSYALKCADEKHVVARTEYGESFTSIVNQNNIFGIQFHPEKSQKAGQLLFRNFLNL
jgi:imidazole glycerol-phosphate synthase subunit HisH